MAQFSKLAVSAIGEVCRHRRPRRASTPRLPGSHSTKLAGELAAARPPGGYHRGGAALLTAEQAWGQCPGILASSQRELHDRRQRRDRLCPRRRHRRRHPELAAGERPVPGGSRRPGRRLHPGHRRSGGQGHRADLRRTHLHRRRRHHRARLPNGPGPASRTSRRSWRPLAQVDRRGQAMARRWAAGWRARWPPTTASPSPRRAAACRRTIWASCPAPAAPSACRASSARKRRWRWSPPSQHVAAPACLAMGLVDELAEEGQLRQGAVAFAAKVLAEHRPLTKVRVITEKI